MTDIEVPGTVPAPPFPQDVSIGLGAFFVLLQAALVWMATDAGDPSLWALPHVMTVMMAALVGLIVSNHVGKASHIRLTWRKDCWAALGSHTGQLLILAASVIIVLIAAGFIIALPKVHFVVWLLGLIGLFGVPESIMRLRTPIGWRFNQYMLSVIVPKEGYTAFLWDEVERVELSGRMLTVTGKGNSVKSPSGNIASDPAVLARVMEFYRTNRRSRPELADERFLERLRSGQL